MNTYLIVHIFPYLTFIDKIKLDLVLYNNVEYIKLKNNNIMKLKEFKYHNYYYFLKKWKKCGHLSKKCCYWDILVQVKKPKYPYYYYITGKFRLLRNQIIWLILLFQFIIFIYYYFKCSSCVYLGCLPFIKNYIWLYFYYSIYNIYMYFILILDYCKLTNLFTTQQMF